MHQWISAVNSYYYPYMCYHVSHERNVFPQLGIRSDEKVVAHALPKIEAALQVMERQLAHGQGFLLGGQVGLADYYLLPSTYAFGFAPEAKAMYADFPAVREWRENIEALPTVQSFRAAQPPRAHRARPQMGGLAPPEILTRQAGAGALCDSGSPAPSAAQLCVTLIR